jgi:hypothetical protein
MEDLEQKIALLATEIARQMMDDGRPPMTLKKFGERNGRSRSSVYVDLAEGRGPETIKVGVRGRRVTYAAERAWRAKQAEGSTVQTPSPQDDSAPAVTEAPHQT